MGTKMGLALLWTGKMGFTLWDWDLATGNGMNNYKMGMGFLFFSGLLLRNFIFLFQNIGAKTAEEKKSHSHFIIVHPIPSG